MMLEHLKALCQLNGISGREDAVQQYIIKQLETWKLSYQVDPLGNILVEKDGQKPAKTKLMISAHMDEIGGIVTYVHEDGTLQFEPVGGIQPSVVIGRQVTVGENPGLSAVVGTTPIHLLSAKQRTTSVTFSDLFLDYGASSRETAQKLTPPGTSVYFRTAFEHLGNHCVRSKALDDRIGCAILLDLLESDSVSFTAAFLVQEEIGLRGAGPAAYQVNPDVAIVLEGTTASDCADATGADQVCCLGKGPVISFMDRATMYDRELYQLAGSICEQHGLPWQTKNKIAGGNDSGAIHMSRNGVRTLAISAPCRYIHSPSSVANLEDIMHCETLTKLLMEKVVQSS